MATQTPAFVQNENLHIHRGKGIDGVKADLLKPKKKGLKERKALADLSKAGKPLLSKGKETTRKASKSNSLTEEQVRKCEEWAKEGIEYCHFTGNDMQKLEEDILEECVRKEVDMVMSSMRNWTQMAYDVCLPVSEAAKDTEPTLFKMELEPKVAHPDLALPIISGEEFEDPFPEAEISFSLLDEELELKLKLKEFDGELSCF